MMNVVEDALIAVLDSKKGSVSGKVPQIDSQDFAFHVPVSDDEAGLRVIVCRNKEAGLDREIFAAGVSVYLRTKDEALRNDLGHMLKKMMRGTLVRHGQDAQVILNKTKSVVSKSDLALRARSLDLLDMVLELNAGGKIKLSSEQKAIVARRVHDILKTAERTKDSDIVLSRVEGTRHLRRYVFG